MKVVYNFFGGRTTFFGMLFSLVGIVGFFLHLLNGSQFLGLIGAIHSLGVGRAIMDDYHERNNKDKADVPS